LWLSSVWLSCQIQHWLSAAAVAVTAVVVAVVGLMAAEAVASIVAAGLMAVEDIAVAGMAAHGLMVAEEVAPQAVGLKRAAIPVRPEIGRRRTFVPQSTMASGIRSATPVVPLVPRV
jgi:phosphosulfolactate phosphohydrolase-like enzyme